MLVVAAAACSSSGSGNSGGSSGKVNLTYAMWQTPEQAGYQKSTGVMRQAADTLRGMARPGVAIGANMLAMAAAPIMGGGGMVMGMPFVR